MDPRDPLLLRWLSRVQSDAPLELGAGAGDPSVGLSPGEAQVWRRLQLVQGLLGTLDHRTAPGELDTRIAEMVQKLDAPEQVVELELQPASPFESTDPAVPTEAPEFLDRLVRQKFEVMAAEMAKAQERQADQERQAARARRRLARPLRRVSLVASGLLVVVLMPWGAMLAKHQGGATIQLTEYTSLDGLRAAHPEAAHFASQTGEFGVFFGEQGSQDDAREGEGRGDRK